MRLFVAVMIGLAFGVFPDTASACSCLSSGVPCGALSEGSPVFIGSVQARSDASESRGHDFRLAVVETFSGGTAREVTVRTAADTAACGYPFEVGKTYLVYARREADGRYTVSLCSRTRPLDDADDDIALLRQIPTGRVVSRVFGAVLREKMAVGSRLSQAQPSEPLGGVPIVARRGHFERWTATDAAGRFVFEGLPPGRYSIEPRWTPGLKSMFEVEPTDVGPCGAGEVFFWAVSEAPLGGTVRTPDGKPVGRNVVVTVIRVDPSAPRGSDREARSAREFTDASGNWAFDGLTAGLYLVGVNLLDPPTPHSPYARTYHASGADESKATPVQVVEGRQARVDLRVGPPIRPRTLSGAVLDETGAPVARAFIKAVDLETQGAAAPTVSATTDAEGRFTIAALDGRRYALRAISYKPRTEDERHGEIVVTQQTGTLTGLRLVVTP
jgi:hypothetical protein